MNSAQLFGVLIFFYFIDFVSSLGCTSCPKGTNPLECLNEYNPSFPLDDQVCRNIRDEKAEVKRLCKKYGGNYLVKCELADYSEQSCVVTCIKSSPRKSVGTKYSSYGSYGHQVTSSVFLVTGSVLLSVYGLFKV